MPEWLPRVPLALVACARALLIPGEAGTVCAKPLEWPGLRLGLGERVGATGRSAPLRAPAR